jgi:hypothetical protein
MAAPEFVPLKPLADARSYESPPWRGSRWYADRPGEIEGLQPVGEQLGTPGPDQGYALTLAARFADKLQLTEGEHATDVLAGASAVAMKRSGLFGRAPVVHDLTVALTVWGFLDSSPDPALVAVRRELFEEVHHYVHYTELRRIVDAVPEAVLRQPHVVTASQHAADWRSCLDLAAE